MSPADNAAREPSMDEILASIRRIIEDNDAGQPEHSAQSEALSQVQNVFQANEVANRPQLNAVPDKEYAPAIAATHDATTFSSSDTHDDLTEVPQTVDAARVAKPVLAPHQKTTDSDAKSAPVLDITTLNDEKENASSKDLASMISNQAAERVSASFGALSHALDANKDSSLTTMTEEMLQPMLREWIDNNLPVIVERLVREEIERLARGEM